MTQTTSVTSSESEDKYYKDWRNWIPLIQGSYSIDEVKEAVNNDTWQLFRIHLKNTTLKYRHESLTKYLAGANTEELAAAKIRVTNYVHALHRGGMIIIRKDEVV